MKPGKLNINEWQDLLLQFKKEKNLDPVPPIAMRVENTILSSARYSGGMTYNGHMYTYFEPTIPDKPANSDGSPYVAWLMVRDDFLKWVTRQKKGGEE